MGKTKTVLTSLISTLLHGLELVVAIGIAYLVLHLFNLGNEQQTLVLGVLLDVIAKGLRAFASPIPDYVNSQK